MPFFAFIAILASLASVLGESAMESTTVQGSNLTFHAPASISQCETINVSWSGVPGPYRFAAIDTVPRGSESWKFDIIIPITNETSTTWTVNYPAGKFLAIGAAAYEALSGGPLFLSPNYAYHVYATVGPGDSWCLSGNGTSSAATGPSSSSPSQALMSSRHTVSSGVIAGITVAVLVVIILIAVLAGLYWRRRRKAAAKATEEQSPGPFEVDEEPSIVPTAYTPTSPSPLAANYDRARAHRLSSGAADKSTTALNRYNSADSPSSSSARPLPGPSKPDAVSRAELLRALTLLEAEVARPDMPRGSMQEVLQDAKLLRESQDVSPLALQQAAEVLCDKAAGGHMPDSYFAQVMAVAFRFGAAVNENSPPVARKRPPLPEPEPLTHAQDGGSVIAVGDNLLPPVYNPRWQAAREGSST